MKWVQRLVTEFGIGKNEMFNPKQRSREQLMKIRMGREGDDKTKLQLYKLRSELAREINPLESQRWRTSRVDDGRKPHCERAGRGGRDYA